MKKTFWLSCLWMCMSVCSLVANLDEALVGQMKRGIVSIKARTSNAAYAEMGESYGTGFVVDREHGIILTNRHVVGGAASATYEVTFHNGREADALLMYFDAWQDFAFLKVDPKSLPEDVIGLELLPGAAYLGQSVTIIGKNAGQNFSVQTGQVSNIYESVGALPSQSLRISLNTRGGGSGSPVLNDQGKVIGLIFSSNMDSFAFGMLIEYAADALKAFNETQTPPARKSTGALVQYYSLDKSSKYESFPSAQIPQYLAKYPNSFNQALHVSSILSGSPAEDVLKVGDIIHAVNGTEIGPDLYLFDKLVNQSISEFIRVSVWRKGDLKDLDVGTYDVNAEKITRMLSFGGALFYEIDDMMSAIVGVNKGGVMVTNIFPGTTFHQVFPSIPGTETLFIQIVSMDGEPVASLDDLIERVPALLQKKHFVVTFRNLGFSVGYNNLPYFTRREAQTEVSISPLDELSQVYGYDSNAMQWNVLMAVGN